MEFQGRHSDSPMDMELIFCRVDFKDWGFILGLWQACEREIDTDGIFCKE